jgi:hypothetical protein
MSRNLRRHQWQIGDLVFGRGTAYPVLGVAIQSYNVTAQDFQVPLSDTVTMGQDTFQAQPITFTIGVRENAPMPYIGGHLPHDLEERSSKLLDELQFEWKGNDVKQVWGEAKPITYCNGFGSTRQIFGRPRKFGYTSKTETSQFRKVTAEYVRVDTVSYSEVETGASLVNGADPVSYTRTNGKESAWYRVLLTGPMTNPLVQVGDNQILLQHTIPAGKRVEVSSYPWSRRIIDSDGNNLRTTLVGSTKYLDQLLIPAGVSVSMSLLATGMSGASDCTVLWKDAYSVL